MVDTTPNSECIVGRPFRHEGESLTAEVEVAYGGGGEVLSQMELSRSGDIYVAPEQKFMEAAVEKGVVMTDTVTAVAWMVPAIAVPAGYEAQVRPRPATTKASAKATRPDPPVPTRWRSWPVRESTLRTVLVLVGLVAGGLALQLGAAALSAGRRRAAWAAGSVAVAVALAVAIATMVTSFRSTVEGWTEAGMHADVWVRPLAAATGVWIGRLDPEIVTIAEELFGPESVDPFYSETVAYRGRPVSFAGAAFDVVQHYGSVPFTGRDSAAVFAEAYRKDGVVVNEPFANRFGVREGDLLRLELPRGDFEREVVGVFRDYSRSHGLVVADRRHFLRNFPNTGPDDMALFLPPGSDSEAARERMLEAVRGRFLIEALINRELKSAVLSAFERTFAITTAMYLVAAVVAVVVR